jgi:hypothetical protein
VATPNYGTTYWGYVNCTPMMRRALITRPRIRRRSISLGSPIMYRYCGRFADLLRMRSNFLIHNNLMLRSERRERLEAWATRDSPISHSQY